MATAGRYSIEIKDIETGQVVVFTAADWTDQQRRIAIAQTMRLAGLPCDGFSGSGHQPQIGNGDGLCRN